MALDRHRLTDIYTDDFVYPGRKRYGLWKLGEINMDTYRTYIVRETDLMRLDYIAYRVYGDSTLWWAIAWVNNIENPLRDLEIGQTLKIPQKQAITNSLTEKI